MIYLRGAKARRGWTYLGHTSCSQRVDFRESLIGVGDWGRGDEGQKKCQYDQNHGGLG